MTATSTIRSGTTNQVRRPNIVLLYAEDLGWGDLSCFGNRRVDTTHLDRLAAGGTRFTTYYSPSPVCSPARAGIMTGQYPARHRINSYLKDHRRNSSRGMADYLDPRVPNYADLLRGAGYVTAHFGKWHLGETPDAPEVKEYGFDEATVWCQGNGERFSDLTRHRSSEVIIDGAIDFVRRHADGPAPFLANVWLRDMHSVIEPSDEQLGAVMEDEEWKLNEFGPVPGAYLYYYAALRDMDRQIGRLLDALDGTGVAENTLVIFTADHGPDCIQSPGSGHAGVGDTGPFRGRKYTLYEGGIRVPFVARWPGHLAAGAVDDTVIAGIDFLPTFCELAGVDTTKVPAVDGCDQSGLFSGKRLAREAGVIPPSDRKSDLFWYYYDYFPDHHCNRSPLLAVRSGPWKLLANPGNDRVELYHIPDDPGEIRDLSRSADHCEVRGRLVAELTTWFSGIPARDHGIEDGLHAYPWPQSTA